MNFFPKSCMRILLIFYLRGISFIIEKHLERKGLALIPEDRLTFKKNSKYTQRKKDLKRLTRNAFLSSLLIKEWIPL